MNPRFIHALLALVGVFLYNASALAVSYTATLLHPASFTNSIANDVATSIQIGTGRGGDHPTLDHALLWNSTSASVIDLHPSGFTQSFGLGASNTNQVGYGQVPQEGTRALLWNGTADSVVNLQPAGYSASVATAVHGNQQVGYGRAPSNRQSDPNHALLWNSTASSVVDLHPAGFQQSQAFGISGTSQVGRGYVDESFFGSHALLWYGTAASVVDLHPTGFDSSVVWASSGDWQVGDGGFGFQTHALLWHGTAASVIDLNPAGPLTYSTAKGISIAGQVGSSRLQFGLTHATYWNGSAASAVDLHPFLNGLGINFIESVATSISDQGIVAGYAYSQNKQYAVMWTPVPEPASCSLLSCGFFAALFINNRRRRLI